MPWIVAVALLVVPILEIYVIIQVGQVIGGKTTVALLILESILGAWLVKREGRRAWTALQTALRTAQMPGRQLADAALVLVGGTLLLTPGFLTDIVGFFFILPFTRPLARRLLAGILGRRLVAQLGGNPITGFMPGGGYRPRGGSHPGGPLGGPPGGTAGGRRPPGNDDVVQGEVVDPDDRPDPAR